MKRAILFSAITESNSQTILSQIFNHELKNKSLAYMPSDGIANSSAYIEEWQGYAEKFGAIFNVVNNHSTDETEKAKLLDSNILLIGGGNTFTLLKNLRKSGLDLAIIEFTKKPNFIISGLSAGAIVLTPTIEVCNLPNFDENLVGITDLSGLGLFNFEVFPHYVEESDQRTLENYRSSAQHQVRELSDEDYIIVEM